LQEVEGVRRDVRVVNLSLLNTNWYIKQLRDREPKVDIQYSDAFIDSSLTDTSLVKQQIRYWPEPKEITAAGLKWKVAPAAGYNVLRIQDVMMIKIIDWNQWRRPIHIAITVPEDNQVSVGPYLQLTGMTYRLTREIDPDADVASLERNLHEVFQFRGINDPDVYLDEQSRRLLTNYRAGLLQLAETYVEDQRADDVVNLLAWGEKTIQYTWDTYYMGAEILGKVGLPTEGAVFMEKAGMLLSEGRESLADAAYYNLIAVAERLVDEYDAPQRAKNLFAQAVRLRPDFFRATFGLSATVQLLGDPAGAAGLLEHYADRYGSNVQLDRALEILRSDIKSRANTSVTP
jgi:hypothetical protein